MACVYTERHTERPRAERAYEELKALLLVGEFPIGQRLGEERLASRIGVSRTPVREALSRLHVEGFVERMPEGGFRPAAPDLDHIHELYEIRIALERTAMARPGTTGATHDRDQLVRLRDDWIGLQEPPYQTDPSFVLLDEDFHLRLAAAAGNRALVDQLNAVNERIRIVRVHDFLTAERVERTIDQHLGILDAVLAGDLALAAHRLDHHFDESLAVVEERASRALARMLGASLGRPPSIARPGEDGGA